MTIAGCRHCIAASRVINGHGEAIHGEARAHCRGNRSWLVVAAECRASSHGRCGRATSRARGSEDRLHLTGAGDRKSTRLNSSHSQISYAVFCLKKKKTLYHID